MNGEIMVEERLDRFCASTDWSMLFPEAKVYHIDSDISDYLPILMKCRPRCARSLAYKKQFRFENMWVLEPTCRETIMQA